MKVSCIFRAVSCKTAPFFALFLYVYEGMSFLRARRTDFAEERPEEDDDLSGDAEPEHSPYVKAEFKEQCEESKKRCPHEQRYDHVVSSF